MASTMKPMTPALRDNALLKKNSLPLFSDIEPTIVTPAIEFDLENLKQNFQAFESFLKEAAENNKDYDYESTVERLEIIKAPLTYSWGVVNHLMGVRDHPDLRTAHDALQPQVIQIYQQLGQSKALFQAVSQLKTNSKVWDQQLDEAQQRIITSFIRQMESSGVGLEGEVKEKFNKLQLELADLKTKFSNNLLDATKAFKLKLTQKEEVHGLPESARKLASQQAVKEGYDQSTPETGPWVITLDMPSYLPAMQHLKSRKVREELYKAFVTRASEFTATAAATAAADKDNAPLIQRILQIKKEISQILGYSSYAEQSLSKKMAPNVESVLSLIDMLLEKSKPIAEIELQQVKDFARKQQQQEQQQGGGNENEELQLWDIPYWSERLRESSYQFEEESLRPYFALPNVLTGLFSLATRLFDITIEAADGETQVWHPDVRYFVIKDSKTGDRIASFFLDPYSRPSEKRGGAWMDVCVGKSRVLPLGRVPVAYLTCNGSPPVAAGQPSLMTFREVETLFHEFGHGLQHMLTTVPHADAAGINNVEWDAVELPSQFMENWCYDDKTLYGFAKHFETGEPLPRELFNKVKAAKNFQAGMQMIRQLYFGAMDLELHSARYDPFNPTRTIFDLQHELARKYAVIPPLDNDRFLCSFSHIFAGGYSAGYYSYKWAEVMSADAFGAFEEVGLENEEKVQETGKKFRETVLSMGGGKAPMEVFKLFRGREPSPEALLRHSGLTK